jgi:two-component system sensor histidine kinase VicK
MDLLPVGVLLIGKDGRLLRANGPGLSHLGFDNRAIGRDDFLSTMSSDALRRAVAAPANGVVHLNIEEGGRSLYVEIRAAPEEEHGDKLVVLRDISGLRTIAGFNRNFAFDLLHKIRTPLTTIMSVLSMATSGTLDLTGMDLGEILGMGAREAERLTALLSRLKDLFLVETGAIDEEAAIERIPVSWLLNELTHEMRPLFLEKEQVLHEADPPSDLLVQADRDLSARALEMVLSNANLYTPPGGTIRMTVESDQGQVRIRIEDDGPGIPADELPHVCERFYRGDSPEVRNTRGEGLGLYLARRLILAQGGCLVIDSDNGEGTSVEITLAAADPEEL